MKRLSLLSFPLCLAALAMTLLAADSSRAPARPISTLTLVPVQNELLLDLTFNPRELTFLSELDANRDGRLDPGEWSGQGEKIARRILERLILRVNDQPVVAEIAGLTQSYESHDISVRAHFTVAARRARVSLESQLAVLTSGSHMTQVAFGNGERVQTAQLDRESNKVTFEPAGALARTSLDTTPGQSAQMFSAFQTNETAVAVLLGLLFLAGIPPAFFSVLFHYRRAHQHPIASSEQATVTARAH
jgi:hypothetical protein